MNPTVVTLTNTDLCKNTSFGTPFYNITGQSGSPYKRHFHRSQTFDSKKILRHSKPRFVMNPTVVTITKIAWCKNTSFGSQNLTADYVMLPLVLSACILALEKSVHSNIYPE